MDVDWHRELMGQMEFYWGHSLRPRLDGLTDEEYLWEPRQPTWSIRPQADGSALIDWALEPADPPPVTTLAWRICHIAGPVLEMRWSSHFGDGTWTPMREDWPATAAGALAWLDDAYRRWHDAVYAHPERLVEPAGPAEGPYQDAPFATLVLHITREMCHHGGEIGTLRDLYRARYGGGLRAVSPRPARG